MSSETLIMLPLWYFAFLLAITIHEAAHALAAMWGGDKTAYEQGQVSINPIPHIKREPVGTTIVPLISYIIGGWMIGWASAPYDPIWARNYPRRAAWMALAGPVSNLLLVFLAATFIHIGIAAGVFMSPSAVDFSTVVDPTGQGIFSGAAKLLSIIFSLNLLLFVFNLIPVPPLDGSSVVTLLMPEGIAKQFQELMENPTYAMVGLLIAWNVFDQLFDPIFLIAINLLYPGSGYA